MSLGKCKGILDKSIDDVIIDLGAVSNATDIQVKLDAITEAIHSLTSGVRTVNEIRNKLDKGR